MPSCSAMKRIGWSSTMASPTSAVTMATSPDTGAWMTCSIFIASITTSSWPANTRSPSLTNNVIMVPWRGAGTAVVPAGPSMAAERVVTSCAWLGASDFPNASTARGSLVFSFVPASPALTGAESLISSLTSEARFKSMYLVVRLAF